MSTSHLHVKLPPTLICGLVRNGGDGLFRTLQALDRLKERMDDWHALIVTNDNTDQTDVILRDWAASDPRHEIVRLDGLISAIPVRLERITLGRNIYLHHLQSRKPGKYSLVAVLDLDGPNEDLDAGSIVANIAKLQVAWDGIFANQRRAYYDIYALRHEKWCPTDCWHEVKSAAKFPFRARKYAAATVKYVHERQVFIPDDHPPIRVRSAFGGLAFYKADALRSAWYGCREAAGRTTCEHAVLNRQIFDRGGRLFILPGLLNDAPLEHLGPTSGRHIPAGLLS